MKLLFPAVVCLLINYTAFSQNQFGIFAGPQATTAGYTINSIKQKNSYKIGFQAGATMKVPFEGNLYFAPAVFYSYKGYKVDFNQFVTPPGPEALNNNTGIHTFEIAPMLQIDFGKNANHFYVKGGPSLDFQLFGKEKFDTLNGSVSRTMKWGYSNYGRYSANAIIQLGYETGGGFFIFGHYSFGLTSINNADFGPKIRHKVFGISIGKYLHKGKITMDTRNKE